MDRCPVVTCCSGSIEAMSVSCLARDFPLPADFGKSFARGRVGGASLRRELPVSFICAINSLVFRLKSDRERMSILQIDHATSRIKFALILMLRMSRIFCKQVGALWCKAMNSAECFAPVKNRVTGVCRGGVYGAALGNGMGRGRLAGKGAGRTGASAAR